MLDAFSRVVSQADTRGEFLSSEQLDALGRIVSDGEKRIDAVNCISSNASMIVGDAARSLFAEQPQLIAPGGNAYTSRRTAACLRDMEIILRYVTYAIFSGDSSVLDDRCLNGLYETYIALGTPSSSVADSIQKMKAIALSTINRSRNVALGDYSSILLEVSSYFDRASAAVVGIGSYTPSIGGIGDIYLPGKGGRGPGGLGVPPPLKIICAICNVENELADFDEQNPPFCINTKSPIGRHHLKRKRKPKT